MFYICLNMEAVNISNFHHNNEDSDENTQEIL